MYPSALPRTVGNSDLGELPNEPGGLSLRPGESIVLRWSAPGGKGILTDQRCLLLGRPRPFRRELRWSAELQELRSLIVQQVRGIPGAGPRMRGSAGAFLVTGRPDPTYNVLVDGQPIFIGEPNACARIQEHVDRARTARCVAVFGHLAPYAAAIGPTPTGGPTIAGSLAAAEVLPDAPTVLGAPFVLFLSGESFRDAVPGARRPYSVSLLRGGTPMAGYAVGGHVPADADPGQLYGPEAAMGRRVLDLAATCGTRVRVVDVEHPGTDAELVRQYASPERVLPILVRADGARLDGADAMVPARLAPFLHGR
jgi:hypothetical protein